MGGDLFYKSKSWYPVPERAMFRSAIPIQPLPAVPMTPQCVQVMRDWVQTFGAAVRQRFARQETAMARAGALSSYLYQRQVRPGESVSLERSGEQRRNEAEEADVEDGILEYDSSSSEVLDDEVDDDVGGIPPLDREATFLLGTVSRFGRTVRFNSRIIV